MKRYILSALVALMAAAGAQADSFTKEESNYIFGKGKFFRIGYSWAETARDGAEVEKPSWGFSLTKGTSYRFPTIANRVKFGIDAVWIDMQVAKYKNPYGSIDNWTSDFEGQLPDDSSEDNDLDYFNHLGCFGITGSMGVGPSVVVAPFSLSDNKKLQPLRAGLYCYYMPTFGMYAKSDNGDFEASYAFVNQIAYGGYIGYRKIAVGLEGRYGTGKFKPLEVMDISLGGDKYTRKFATTRLYIQFAF